MNTESKHPTARSVRRDAEGNIVAEFSLLEMAEFARKNRHTTIWASQDGIETPVSSEFIREALNLQQQAVRS
jgi:hypothetical protein